MKTDIHYIPRHQTEVHQELVNWAMTVADGRESKVSPMFAQYRSHAWQWHEPEFRPTCFPLRGWETNEKVKRLPELYRKAIKWFYLERSAPHKKQRELGVSLAGLNELVIMARTKIEAQSANNCNASLECA
jgi:hypothetical protein